MYVYIYIYICMYIYMYTFVFTTSAVHPAVKLKMCSESDR